MKIPRMINQALALDSENGNTLWRDSIGREMNAILLAFNILREKAPPGYARSTGHIIFDVKMDFSRKSCWVKDRHLTR